MLNYNKKSIVEVFRAMIYGIYDSFSTGDLVFTKLPQSTLIISHLQITSKNIGSPNLKYPNLLHSRLPRNQRIVFIFLGKCSEQK